MTDIKIRKLNNSDFWAMLQILRKGGKEAFSKMRDADDADSDLGRAMVLFETGMEFAEREMQSFFASLAGMSVEEFKNADFDLTLSIIEQLDNDNDLTNFFKRAAALAKKFFPKVTT